MWLPIAVQLCTLVAAICVLYFGQDQHLIRLAAVAATITAAVSIMLVVRSERDAAYSKNALTNLIRAVQPSEYIREVIKSRVLAEAASAGLSDGHVRYLWFFAISSGLT
jgi:hypothetical protein